MTLRPDSLDEEERRRSRRDQADRDTAEDILRQQRVLEAREEEEEAP